MPRDSESGRIPSQIAQSIRVAAVRQSRAYQFGHAIGQSATDEDHDRLGCAARQSRQAGWPFAPRSAATESATDAPGDSRSYGSGSRRPRARYEPSGSKDLADYPTADAQPSHLCPSANSIEGDTGHHDRDHAKRCLLPWGALTRRHSSQASRHRQAADGSETGRDVRRALRPRTHTRSPLLDYRPASPQDGWGPEGGAATRPQPLRVPGERDEVASQAAVQEDAQRRWGSSGLCTCLA